MASADAHRVRASSGSDAESKPHGKGLNAKVRKFLMAMNSRKNTTRALEKLLVDFIVRRERSEVAAATENEKATLGLAEFLKAIFVDNRDLVKEAFKAAEKVESCRSELFEDALVLALEDLEGNLVTYYSNQSDWKHFVLLLANALERWGQGDHREKLLDFAENILSKWINPMTNTHIIEVDPTGSLLYSACCLDLLGQCGSVLLEAHPTDFGVLNDMVYQRILSDDLPKPARSSYLETLLTMDRLLQQRLRESSSSSSGSERMRGASGDANSTAAGEKSDLESSRKVVANHNANVVNPLDLTVIKAGKEKAKVEKAAATLLDKDAKSMKHVAEEAVRSMAQEEEDPRLIETPDRTPETQPIAAETATATSKKAIVVAHLKCLNKSEPPFLVSTHQPLVLGRNRASCHVVVQDPRVSRVHAEIRATENRACLVLVTKTNVITVDQRKYYGSDVSFEKPLDVPLRHGAQIQIGTDLFELEYVVHTDQFKTSSGAQDIGITQPLEESYEKRHPDHPGSPVKFGVALDSSKVIKPKAIRACEMKREMPTSALPGPTATDSGEGVVNPHDFDNKFVVAPTLRRLRQMAILKREQEMSSETNRKPGYSGSKFRNELMLARGDRFQPKPKFRDIYREQEDHLKIDESCNNVLPAISSVTEENTPRDQPVLTQELLDNYDSAAIAIEAQDDSLGESIRYLAQRSSLRSTKATRDSASSSSNDDEKLDSIVEPPSTEQKSTPAKSPFIKPMEYIIIPGEPTNNWTTHQSRQREKCDSVGARPKNPILQQPNSTTGTMGPEAFPVNATHSFKTPTSLVSRRSRVALGVNRQKPE